MSIIYSPKKGQILMCDFTSGFAVPEMVKERPVVVFKSSSRNKLVTVIPLSTKKPELVQAFHMLMPVRELPNTRMFKNVDNWLKGDMIYTVGWHRLKLIQLGRKNGKRTYFLNSLTLKTLTEVEKSVINGIGLGRLEKHLK